MSRHRQNAAKQNNRLSVNIVSFLVTCAILFVGVAVSDGGFANSINKITKNLDFALQDLMDDMPKFSDFVEKEVFLSNAHFNPRGMTGLYNLTNKFTDLIIPKNFLKEGLIVIEDNSPRIGRDEIMEILRINWGILAVLCLLVLIGVLIPICGLFFCCCRCCGRCGARSQPCDKKRDLCKKILQGTFLIILGTGLLFCVVCAFASNQQLQDGVDSLPEHLQNSEKDTNSYLESTKRQAHHLLVVNYQEFATVFRSTMNKSSQYVMQQLEIWSNATAMMDLYAFVDNIPKIRGSLETLKTDTNTLRASASQLNDAMRKVKKDLLHTLQKCATNECDAIKNNISQLQTNIDFNKLPDVSPTLHRLNDLDLNSLQRATKEGKEKLTNIQDEIEVKLRDTLADAVQKVDEAGDTIKSNLNEITDTITHVQTEFNRNVGPAVTTINDNIRSYGQYRYYGGLAISCVLLLIIICIALGLICGICGKRPDGYSDNCCNKGAGSQFLICAVMIMFIFGIIVAVVTIATFIVGVAYNRVVCYPIRNPENSTVIKLVDEFIRYQSEEGNDINVAQVLTNCYQNKSAYHVLNLKRIFDIDTIHEQFDISSFLQNMNTQLKGIIGKNFTILNSTNEKALEDLKNFDPSINFDQFQDELKQNFTNLSLNDISKKLEELVVSISDNPNLQDVKSDIQLSILHINTYDEKLLIPMKELANSVIDIAQQLDTDLRMNSSSFSEAVNKLLNEIIEAQLILQDNGTEILQKVATQFGEMVGGQVNSYLHRVGNVTKYELGQCGPLSVMINSTLTATCDKIGQPWNGFWLSLLLSLLLFIPTIIISVKLATLYQKFKQYGQYIETRGKRGKKKAKKSKHYEDRPQNMGGEVVAREFAAGTHPPDARYADMAPKNWEEFPNGGPPQYQRAPTEYERPPPYYYPGTGEQ